MSNVVEIIVRKAYLSSCEKEMRELYNSTVNNSLVCVISESKGDVADELNNIVSDLSKINNSLASLIEKTADAIKTTRTSFEEVDFSLASLWCFMGRLNEK